VHAGPDGLRDELHVFQFGAEQVRLDGLAHHSLEKGVGILLGVVFVDVEGRLVDRWPGRHEHQTVVIGVVQAELHVGVAGAAKAFDRIGNARDPGELLREMGEVRGAQLDEERLLVAEVEVDRGGGVLDPVGDAAHGDGFVTFADEQLARGIEDAGAGFFAFPLASFLRSQNAPPKLNNVKLCSSVQVVKARTETRAQPCAGMRGWLRSGLAGAAGGRRSVRDLLHQVVDLVEDGPDRALQRDGVVIGNAPVGREHVQDLVTRQQNVGEPIQHALGERHVHRRDGIELDLFRIHSA
jgi:hypothetical protein